MRDDCQMKGWRGVGRKQKEEIDLYLPDTNISDFPMKDIKIIKP